MKTILQIEDRNPNKDNIHNTKIKLWRRNDKWWAIYVVKNLMKFSFLLYLQRDILSLRCNSNIYKYVCKRIAWLSAINSTVFHFYDIWFCNNSSLRWNQMSKDHTRDKRLKWLSQLWFNLIHNISWNNSIQKLFPAFSIPFQLFMFGCSGQ